MVGAVQIKRSRGKFSGVTWCDRKKVFLLASGVQIFHFQDSRRRRHDCRCSSEGPPEIPVGAVVAVVPRVPQKFQ